MDDFQKHELMSLRSKIIKDLQIKYLNQFESKYMQMVHYTTAAMSSCLEVLESKIHIYHQ